MNKLSTFSMAALATSAFVILVLFFATLASCVRQQMPAEDNERLGHQVREACESMCSGADGELIEIVFEVTGRHSCTCVVAGDPG